MEKFLGIDIGGTNVKFGVVNSNGELLSKVKHPTAEVNKDGKFVENFKKNLREQLNDNPEIIKIGIGIPGTLSEDRRTLMELANIPSLNGTKFIPELEKSFPKHKFWLENDANAAALGEYYFGDKDTPESYLFITLGTGVGGAAIIHKKIFKGADGNGMEIGHILGSDGGTIEDQLGKRGIISNTRKLLEKGKYNSSLKKKKNIDSKVVAKAAHKGDKLALKVYDKLGKSLGECIVAGVRILDTKTILIGGGVAETLGYLENSMNKVIKKHLSEYYTKDMVIRPASLKNEAGIIGAASLCFSE